MSCHQHGYPWPSLATSPYYSSPLVGLQGDILCPHIAAVCKFERVVLLLSGHINKMLHSFFDWTQKEEFGDILSLLLLISHSSPPTEYSTLKLAVNCLQSISLSSHINASTQLTSDHPNTYFLRLFSCVVMNFLLCPISYPLINIRYIHDTECRGREEERVITPQLLFDWLILTVCQPF